MFKGLAKAMGFKDKEFDMTEEEVIREILDTAGPLLKGATYEHLKENHWYKVEPGVPYGDMEFPTPSGKIEFYSESIQKDAGLHPVAEYVPQKESIEVTPELHAKYPLQFMTLHTKNYINGQLSQLPHIQALVGEPVVFINPEDATARGINDGDMVIVKNNRGETTLKAKITAERVRPGVVLAYAAPWEKVLSGKGVNSTTSEELSDIGGGSTFHTNLVEVVKA